MTRVTTIDQLESIYDQPPVQRSVSKVLDHLNAEYRRFIAASPFFALATVGPDGMDCSPRGERGAAVVIADERTVHIPDRRGNNRLDSLRNIVVDGRVALLFLVPGAGECLRINGTATLSTSPELLAANAVAGRRPRTVIVVDVESVYFQCARAIKRSELWNPDRFVDPGAVPTAGRMTEAASPGYFDAETYDAELAVRQAETLY